MVVRFTPALTLTLALFAPAALAWDEVDLYARPDGTLAPAPASGSLRDGTYSAAPASAAFELAPGAIVEIPSRALLPSSATAALYLDGQILGEGSASSGLLESGAREIRLSNGEASVAPGSVLALRVSGAGSGEIRLMLHTTPIAAPPPSPPPQPSPSPPDPTPAAFAPSPASSSSSSSSTSSSPDAAAAPFAMQPVADAMPDAPTAMTALLLALAGCGALAFVRLGRP